MRFNHFWVYFSRFWIYAQKSRYMNDVPGRGRLSTIQTVTELYNN